MNGKKLVKVGRIRIKSQVDVTDPCYSDDVWCRETIKNMAPGLYDCFAEFGVDRWGYQRVSKARIVLAEGAGVDELKDRIENGRPWRYETEIGVDAGIAGFFSESKPNFSDGEWSELCNWMSLEDERHKEMSENDYMTDWYIQHFDESDTDGFWTSSGYGDGGYPVYAVKSIIDKKRLVTALEIRFI